ncbi:unnamed protein product [Mucor hiemalis]
MNHRPALGKNVKSLEFNTYTDDKSEVEDVLTSLLSTHLPNVESYSSSFHRSSYLPVLIALLNNQLIRLKTLEKPVKDATNYNITNYTTCALLMKDRLEHLQMFDDYDGVLTNAKQTKLLYNLLYDNLQQFNKLISLSINMKTDEIIKELESITDACKTLEKIVFNFDSLNDDISSSLAIDSAFGQGLKLVPRSNVKSIEGTLKASRFHKVFSYIIDKFPQLKKISLSVNEEDATLSEPQEINLLQKYASKFNDSYYVSVNVNQDTICDAIGDFWVKTSKLGSERLEIHYEDDRDNCQLTIRKHVKSTVTRIYPYYDDYHVQDNFIETYGKYLLSLEFSSLIDNNDFSALDVYELPEHFLGHLVMHCPYLKFLTIENFMIRRSPYFNMDLSKRLSLSLLHIKDSSIYPGALEQLSFSVPKLKKLQLGYNLSYCRKDDDQATDTPTVEAIEIVMSHTTIDWIEFEHPGDEPFYVKFYSLSEQKNYRYKIDFDFEKITQKAISEEEYLAKNDGKYYYICSQTIPQFSFTC